jgi:hypothetical protein
MNGTEIDSLAFELCALDQQTLRLVLLQYALDTTITCRMHFADARYQAAVACNETLHLVLGFLRRQDGAIPRSHTENLVKTILRDAFHNGRIQTVRSALSQIKQI